VTGVYVLLAALAVAAGLAGWRHRTDGRLRVTRAVRKATQATQGATGATGATGGATGAQGAQGATGAMGATGAGSGGDDREDLRPFIPALAGQPEPGERATLVQFSSAFCAPCRATRRVLGDVADLAEGVTHVEIDAESNLELVRKLNILKTPTTLVLDEHGREVARATGQPKKTDVLRALGQAVPS
jgi:thiol-disulfide isomerase/thioredoxin